MSKQANVGWWDDAQAALRQLHGYRDYEDNSRFWLDPPPPRRPIAIEKNRSKKKRA